MKHDISRSTFRPEKRYSSVRMQQGRVLLDADWNEQADLQAQARRQQARDVFGPAGSPGEDAGFGLYVDRDALRLTAGRLYVEGALCRLDADCGLDAQPDLPGYQVPEQAGLYLAYLETWERVVTGLEDPALSEIALDGADAGVRLQRLAQVRLMAVQALPADGEDQIVEWRALLNRQAGRMAARAGQSAEQAASGQYDRVGNHLYRVEIHRGGDTGRASFKWSRENASVAAKWVNQVGDTLVIDEPPKDSALSFAPGQWVELLDEGRELRGEPGGLFRVLRVEGASIVIDVAGGEGSYDIGEYNHGARKLRRWDMIGAGGAIPVADAADWLELENGVQVRFPDKDNLSLRTGEHWMAPARAATRNIEWPVVDGEPEELAPHGPQRDFAQLALLERTAEGDSGTWNVLADYRPVITDLTAPRIEYLSGDGQEGLPGQPLKQPLRARLWRGGKLAQGAVARFVLAEGGGGINAAPGGEQSKSGDTAPVLEQDIVADADGVAACWFALDASLETARVEAWLLDETGARTGAPISFNAAHGLADDVAYDPPPMFGPDGATDHLAEVDTARLGLDKLVELKVNKFGDTMTGPLTVDSDLMVSGRVTVLGDMVVNATEHTAGNVQLGDGDDDRVTVMGQLRSGHSSDFLLVEDAMAVREDLRVFDRLGLGLGLDDPLRAKLQVASGAIAPAAGASDQAGLMFYRAPDSNDGGWLRYFPRSGEASTLELGVGDHGDDCLALMPAGRVGVGTRDPQAKLDVRGDLRLQGPDPALLLLNESRDQTMALTVVDGAGRIDVPGGALKTDAAFDAAHSLSVNGLVRADADGWLYSYNDSGWVNSSHGGGWHMYEPTWLRVFGDKSVFQPSGIWRCDGALQLGSDGQRLHAPTEGGLGVGLGDSSLDAFVQIRPTPAFRNSYNFSETSLLVVAKDDNGGDSLAAPQSTLALARSGVANQSFANMADFRLGRAESAGANAGARLDLWLTDGQFEPLHAMTWRADGYIGAGHAEPKARLHVYDGELVVEPASGLPYPNPEGSWLRLGHAPELSGETTPYAQGLWHASDGHYAFFGSRWESGRVDAVIAWGDQSDEGLRFLHSRAGETGPREYMRLDGEGRLGLGSPDPTAPLHVYRRDETDNNLVELARFERACNDASKYMDAEGGSIGLFLRDDGAYDSLIEGARLSWRFDNADNKERSGRLGLWTCDNGETLERLTIDKTGRVGVGQTNPQARLHVQGDLRLEDGVAIRNISDGPLSDRADSVPTERAVRIYVDENAGSGGGGNPDFINATSVTTVRAYIQDEAIIGTLSLTTRKLTIGGGFDKFYPIVFRDNAWSDGALVLEISMAHRRSGNRGSLLAKFEAHSPLISAGPGFVKAEVHQRSNYFVGGCANVNSRDLFIVWLRGGGVTYTWRAFHGAHVEDDSLQNKVFSVLGTGATVVEAFNVKDYPDVGFDRFHFTYQSW